MPPLHPLHVEPDGWNGTIVAHVSCPSLDTSTLGNAPCRKCSE
jgi:hypothetical protein